MVGLGDAARVVELLESAEGLELLGWLGARGRVGAGEELALGERLRARYPAELVAAAMAQHELRLKARAKFSQPERMLFTRAGLEQSSSELVAGHRAARYQRFPLVADLCTGIGGDLIALSPGRAALAIDLDPAHLRMALGNARALGAGEASGVCADVRDLRLDGLPAVFVDPARRVGGRRLPAGTSEPPLAWCLALADHTDAVGIKAAPGLPLDLVPDGWEVEFIAEGHDLKEAALWSPAMATTSRRATVLPAGHHPATSPPTARSAARGGHTLETPPTEVPRATAPSGQTPATSPRAAPRTAVPDAQIPLTPATAMPGGHTLVGAVGPPLRVAEPGAYLLDPSPAVTRAGLVEELGRELGAWKIDGRVGFLTSDRAMVTPFGRLLAVEASLPWGLKRVRAELRARGAGAVEIRKRGSAVDVEELRRRLDLRGDRRLVVVLTRVLDRPWALVCQERLSDAL